MMKVRPRFARDLGNGRAAGEWSPHQLARGTGRRTAMIFSKCEDRDLFKRHDFSLRTVELLLRHSAASSAARLVDKSSSFSKRVSKLSRITRYRADGLTDYVAPDQSPIYLGFVAARNVQTAVIRWSRCATNCSGREVVEVYEHQ
jgi:hypothetical protein